MNKDKELEEAIEICEDFINENKDRPIIFHTAIKILLKEIENSIPKKKIEDKYNELKKQYEEELEKNSIKTFILKCQIEVLQELLEEK